MQRLTSLFGQLQTSPTKPLMSRNAKRLAYALIKEYGREENFEVSFQERELLSSVAEILRHDFGCVVTEDQFKQGLKVQVPKS